MCKWRGDGPSASERVPSAPNTRKRTLVPSNTRERTLVSSNTRERTLVSSNTRERTCVIAFVQMLGAVHVRNSVFAEPIVRNGVRDGCGIY